MNNELTFEEAMQRLQEIVAALEDGKESLENAMKLFEEGTGLSALCYKTLSQAEQKITEFSKIQAGSGDENAE